MNLNYAKLSDDPIIKKMKENTENLMELVAIGSKRIIMPLNYINYAQKISEMEIRKNDVWIISIPRSGTTWTEEMVWLLCNNLDYESAKSKTLHKRFSYLELASMMGDKKFDSEFWTVDSIINAKSPRFIKTHLPVELLPKQLWEVKPKIIYVYRNPKDVAISQYHFFCMLQKYRGSFEDWAEIFLQEKCMYNPYWDHVLDFWKSRNENDILFLTYETMKNDLTSVVRHVANYLGTRLNPENVVINLVNHLDYKNMKNNASVNQEKQLLEFNVVSRPEDVRFIRKGISGEWRQVMSSQLIQKFDDWTKQRISGTDFNFYD